MTMKFDEVRSIKIGFTIKLLNYDIDLDFYDLIL